MDALRTCSQPAALWVVDIAKRLFPAHIPEHMSIRATTTRAPHYQATSSSPTPFNASGTLCGALILIDVRGYPDARLPQRQVNGSSISASINHLSSASPQCSRSVKLPIRNLSQIGRTLTGLARARARRLGRICPHDLRFFFCHMGPIYTR